MNKYAHIFWIHKEYPGRIGIMTRPSGPDFLEVEMQHIRRTGTDVLVSLLEEEEISQLGLEGEGNVAQELGLRFIHHPIPDRDIPQDFEASLRLIQDLAQVLEEGKNVVLHCRKSIGRSPMIAAAVMVLLGSTTKRAFQQIKKVRGAQVPDQVNQYRWVEEVSELAGTDQKSTPQSFFGKMFGGSF